MSLKKLDFVPSRDGFHFPNNFVDHHAFGITTEGRCGGMAFAALDYYYARLPIPTHQPRDFHSSDVPNLHSRLGDYIYSRLLDSLTLNGYRFIAPPWTTADNWYYWATHDEFVRVRQRIDNGELLVLGLLSREAGSPTKGHQVVAYGYEVDTHTNAIGIYVWDNNYPDREIILKPKSVNEGIQEFYTDDLTRPLTSWYGYFIEAYDGPRRPTYLDIVLEDITLESASLNTNSSVPTMLMNDRLEVSFTVQNVGDFPAELAQLFLYVRGPAGENFDFLLGGGDGNSTSIQPGEIRSIHRTCERFGSQPGRYSIGVSYLSRQGHWHIIPSDPNKAIVNPLQIDVVKPNQQQLVIDKWIEVKESDWLVDTGIDIMPGDEFAFNANGEIWAGVFLTGTNGPNGWDNIDHNPKLPLHDGPDAHPFSLIGKLGINGAYFFIGEFQPRQRYAGQETQRLSLRTNDDTPGNGNGAFSCHIQVWR